MTTETNPTEAVVTEPPAEKRRLRDRLPKRQTVDSETTEASETPKKGRKLHGVYAVGAMLLAAGAIGAVAGRRAGKEAACEVADTSSDTDTTDN